MHFCEYLGEFLTYGAHKMAELSMRETAVSDSFASVDITITWMFVVRIIRLKSRLTVNLYHLAFNCYINSKQHPTDHISSMMVNRSPVTSGMFDDQRGTSRVF